uniref:Uncharacterized protein n=1 Tax=Oryza punctata TaxID=4537 RepID=A0A0E0LXQ5_ORYPU
MEGSLARRRKLPAAEAESLSLSSSPQQRFTALELAVAEQLIHLSESSSSGCGGGTTTTTPRWGGGAAAAAASSSFSFTSASSPRSVNNAPPLPRVGEVDDEDEQEVGGRPRRNRRLRPIAEIYAATAPIGGGGRKAKAKAGVEQ